MNIAVFMGGSSSEREVSLMSGKACAEALEKAGNNVTMYDVEWIGSNALFEAVEKTTKNGTDIVFLALHGGLGENGGVQGILEAAGIPYTGSGITASAVAMDKNISKALFRYHDIPTAPWLLINPENIEPAEVKDTIGYPCVVKPADQGSTLGLSVVRDPSKLKRAVTKAMLFSSQIMVESYITGKELSVPILDEHALPIIEIRPSHEIYDYECKYTSGMCSYVIPADVPGKIAQIVTQYAQDVFKLLGLRDIARIDFRLDEQNCPLCFEANTLPGMTGTSLVPKSAAKAGIDFTGLVTKIAQNAYNRKGTASYGAKSI
ncbi:MAG: D-alanine--D-alanine ligase [Candidatus Latescibacteria bacterium]|nr:D-alanine--D-alanine ligase [Candidatus Latescibacterota bacterium]